MRHISLSEEEKSQLEELQKSSTNSVVRKRCTCLLLSGKGNSIAKVSWLTNVNRRTLERLLNKWEAADGNRISVLYSAQGQGAKVKLQPVADLLPGLIEQHNRNLKPVLEILEKEYSIKVCKSTLQSFLKYTGL